MTRYLIPKGWTLPIVPELDDLTVGGLLLGYGIEASSHRYGLFADIVDAFLKLTRSETIRAYYENKHVCQEVLMPIADLEDSVEFFHGNFEGYPLWLCPHRLHRTEPQGLLKPDEGVEDYEMFVDIGAWYAPGPVLRGEAYDSRRAVRTMQDYVIAHRGYQCLYAVTELTREEFRPMFDCRLYDAVRQKYHAHGVFMDAYDKVKRPSGAAGTSPALESTAPS